MESFGLWNWFRHRPLITLDTVAGTRPNKLYNDYVTHSTYDDFWKTIGLRDKLDKIGIPVYLMSGWYDNYPGTVLKYFQKLTKLRASDETRVAVSPTTHSRNRVVGDRDFGEDAEKDEIGLAIQWLDYLLKGKDNGVQNEPKVRIFVMGVNEWRLEREWPLARTKFTKYYLRTGSDREHLLSTNAPVDEPPTVYEYDPDDPVPTLGGNHSSPNIPGIIRAGPVDQRPNEGREDVLVFTSEPFARDVEVTGPVIMRLYAASSARDADFIVRLIDSDRVYEYTIDLLATSNVVLKGHRIRVHVTSSNFPLWDANPNTGHQQAMGAEIRVAKQTIYHEEGYPSHILLPVIPQ